MGIKHIPFKEPKVEKFSNCLERLCARILRQKPDIKSKEKTAGNRSSSFQAILLDMSLFNGFKYYRVSLSKCSVHEENEHAQIVSDKIYMNNIPS